MRIANWLRLGGSVGVGALILWRVPAGALWSAFENLRGVWLWAALAAALGMLAVRYFQWQCLFDAAKLPVSRGDSAGSFLAGFTLSVVTPGRLGELGRCLFVAEPHRASVLLVNVLERGLDAWALFTYAVVSVGLMSLRPMGVFAVAVWLAVLPVALGLPSLVASVGGLRWWGETFRSQLNAAGLALLTIRTPGFAALSLASTSLDLLTFFFLLRAFHHVDFVVALAVFPWIVIAGGLPVSLGGIGPREGAAALLLAHYAVPTAAAMDAALFLFAFSALLPAVMGGVWILARHLRSAEPRSTHLEAVVPGA